MTASEKTAELAADALVLSMCEADAAALTASDDVFESYGKGLAAIVHDVATAEEFKGKAGSSAFARVPAAMGLPFKLVGVVGVGKAGEIGADAWTALGAAAAAAANKAKCESLVVAKYWMGDAPEEFETKARAIAVGAYLGAFDDQRFKSEKRGEDVAINLRRDASRRGRLRRADAREGDRRGRRAHEAARRGAAERRDADRARGRREGDRGGV